MAMDTIHVVKKGIAIIGTAAVFIGGLFVAAGQSLVKVPSSGIQEAVKQTAEKLNK